MPRNYAARRTWQFSLAALSVCAALMSPEARCQTPPPDMSLSDFSELGAPRPNGRIYATFVYTGAGSATVDGVAYRGSAAAGTAVEILRKTFTFSQGSPTATFDSGQTIPFNEGDIFTVCINPGRTGAESNYNNNCEERVVSAGYSDLAIDVSSIAITPVGAAAGQPITVTANIRNKLKTGAQALIRLFQSHPNSPASKLLGQNSVNVPGSSSAAASFTLTRPPGDSNLWVQVEDVYPRESNRTDNLASRNVFLKAIINTGRVAPGSSLPVPYSSSPAIGDLLGTGQPVMVFAEYPGFGSLNSEARITALQLFHDGTYKELWSKSGFLPPAADALSPALADIDGDGQPEIVFEAVHRDSNSMGGQIGVFVLNKDGSLKWQHIWNTVGRVPCHNPYSDSRPTLGDMNGDGIVDIVVLETDLVVLDGRNGSELARKPGIKNGSSAVCSTLNYSAIADLDGDGRNEYMASGDYGFHVYGNDGTLRWEYPYNGGAFALLDTDKDGKAEIVLPIHRSNFLILDAATGQIKQQKRPSSDWSAFYGAIAATTSVDPAGYPNLAVANNDSANGTGLLDHNLDLKWYNLVPPENAGFLDNPSYVTLADLLGQGRPQVISHSDYRNLGIQDILTGEWIEYFSITGGFFGRSSFPIPVDVDGDGRGEVVVSYSLPWTYDRSFEPAYPAANYLVFGSDQWKKVPLTWNQHYFVPNQVDQKLAFKHDYQPWKTHNTWMQQPVRKPCDVDFDDDVDQDDIAAITSARGQTAPPGDWRDYDKDGLITVNDARACTQRCTLGNCGAINPPGHILSVSPRRVFPGSSVQVTIRAEFLKFKAGQVTLNFGAGVTVSNVQVIDADTLTAALSIAAGQSGDRDITVTSSGVTFSRPSVLSLSAGNLPPVVHAGPQQTLVLPGSITLNGAATDDGLPYGQLGYSWQFVAGPGEVTISNPLSLTTSVSFSREGFYVLRLAASDGQYFAHEDVGVVVIQGNQAPYVSAGPAGTYPQDAAVITLNGDVQDDHLPWGSTVTSQWTKTSGPGTVTFSAPKSPVTNTAFSAPGVYELTLSASDGQLSNSSTVTITVNPPAPRILSIGPASGSPGQTQMITIVSRYTHFAQGSTRASFGAGVSVGGAAAGEPGPVTVVDATTATAQVAVQSGATLGARSVTIATGAEQASKDGVFIVGAIGVPYSVIPNLSYGAIAPGGSVVADPRVVDAAGNEIPGAAGFTMTVTPKAGLAMGAAPAVNGLTAVFPKLQKRLLNQDTEADPDGNYTDGDPADPNYGKETGGIYTVEVTLNGTNVKGSADLVVLPSGTAGITLGALRFATELGTALDTARHAVEAGDTTAISSAKGALAAITGNLDYSPKLLAANNVAVPVNGFPAAYAQVAARFPLSPDDAGYNNSLGAVAAQVRLIRNRIDAIAAASITQADLDALAAGVAAYRSMVAQLGALKPSPAGITIAADQMNLVLSGELPLLLDSVARKSAEALAAAETSQGLQPRIVSAGARAGAADSFLTVFGNLFSIFTDLKGVATANIIELVASLANDLINIATTNLINSQSTGDLYVDFVAAGGQFSFACPSWPDTYVEGTGFSPAVDKNSVVVIGCINSYALRNLLTLKPTQDLAAAIRLFFKIKSLAEAMGRDQGIAATAQPDYLRDGLFDGTDMVFAAGWPRVNQGRLPCVGIVIAFNFDTGAMQAVNVNMLASCN